MTGGDNEKGTLKVLPRDGAEIPEIKPDELLKKLQAEMPQVKAEVEGEVWTAPEEAKQE